MSGHLTTSCPTAGHVVGISQPPKLTTEGVQVVHRGLTEAPVKTGYPGKYSPSLTVLGLPSPTQRHPQSRSHHKHLPRKPSLSPQVRDFIFSPRDSGQVTHLVPFLPPLQGAPAKICWSPVADLKEWPEEVLQTKMK